VEGVLREQQPAPLEQVRVGEVDVQGEVVGLHGRAQDERAVPFQREQEPRKKARIEVEQPRRAMLHLDDVAGLVEHGETVAVFQGAAARSRERNHARDHDRARGRAF